jgi:hypothetical protein
MTGKCGSSIAGLDALGEYLGWQITINRGKKAPKDGK